MKTYAVTIKATIWKTYTVEAESEADANDLANEMFSVLTDGVPEDYDQETVHVEKPEVRK